MQTVTANSSPASRPASVRPTFNVNLATAPAALKTGDAATLLVTVKDNQGAVVRDLELNHLKPLHLLFAEASTSFA